MGTATFLIIFIIVAAVIGAAVALSGSGGDNGSSNIETRDVGRFRLSLDKSLSASERNYIIQGATELSDVINTDTFFNGGNLIPVSMVLNNNISNNVYALAYKPNENYTNKYNGGKIEFNQNVLNAGGCCWSKIVIHEMIHLIGFGLYNEWNNGTVQSGPSLNGTDYSNAHSYYVSAGLPNNIITYNNIPLQPFASGSTTTGHWNEAVFGNEIMTPETSLCTANDLIFSKITAGVLEDTGFNINYSSNTISAGYVLT